MNPRSGTVDDDQGSFRQEYIAPHVECRAGALVVRLSSWAFGRGLENVPRAPRLLRHQSIWEILEQVLQWQVVPTKQLVPSSWVIGCALT